MEEGKDSAYWLVNTSLPGTLILVPSRRMDAVTPEILAALARTGVQEA